MKTFTVSINVWVAKNKLFNASSFVTGMETISDLLANSAESLISVTDI